MPARSPKVSADVAKGSTTSKRTCCGSMSRIGSVLAVCALAAFLFISTQDRLGNLDLDNSPAADADPPAAAQPHADLPKPSPDADLPKPSLDKGLTAAFRSPLAEGTAQAPPGRRTGPQRVAASIAVHPPKFPLAGDFLKQYVACPAVQEELSVHLIFSDEEDLGLFMSGLSRVHPEVPKTSFTAVLANVTSDEFFHSLHIPMTNSKQVVAAWKKWFGIAHLMDLGKDAPVYGLMLDAEVQLFDPQDCGANSHWHKVYDRIKRKEEAKTFNVAKLSDTIRRIQLGPNSWQTGLGHGIGVIKGNANFATHGGLDKRVGRIKDCKAPYGQAACDEVNNQIKFGLFSWWVDLPYVNLEIAEKMLKEYHEKGCPDCYPVHEAISESNIEWKRFLKGIKFPRFEYIFYQQWLCLNEGFRFEDVTNITGYARWGSWLEDIQGKDADLTGIEPLWVSAETYTKAEKGFIKPFSKTAPPVMVFHVDHNAARFNQQSLHEAWKAKVPGYAPLVAFQTHELKRIRDLPPVPTFTGLTSFMCQQKCLNDKACKCVVHGRRFKAEEGKCWLVRQCRDVVEDMKYIMYAKRGA